jgi:hypothetical protein
VISTSHGLLNLQPTMPSAISRFVMLMLCQFPSLSVHDFNWHDKYFYDVIRNSISHKLNKKKFYKRNKKKILMSENGLRKLFRINKIKICPHQIFIFEIHMKGKKENRKAKCILICCFIVEPSNCNENFNFVYWHLYFIYKTSVLMYILWWLCIICITSGETLIKYLIWIFWNINIMKLKDASFLINHL